MQPLTRQELEHAAVEGHAAGDTWDAYWRRYGPHVIALEPHDRRRFHRLVGRLTALVAAGDLDGVVPVGDGWPRPCPWELDDAQGVAG
jgi:hypothetical protein